MQWIEAIVHTTTEGSDLVSDLLVRNGALGTQVLDRLDVSAIKHEINAEELIDDQLVNSMPNDVLVKGWFANEDQVKLDTLNTQLEDLRKNSDQVDLGVLNAEVSAVSDDDWTESWKRYYKPFRVGKRLVIKPSWESYKTQEGDLVIEIDPGMAFGTGTHETTNMCLLMLEEYLKPGMRVMDIGTGSGILAIAAAKLGASEVLAVDIDADAVKVALGNILRNNVGETVHAEKGDMVRGAAIMCELVVANIVAGAIGMLAEPVKRYLQIGGHILCSGILKEREQDAVDSLTKAGYEIISMLKQGEWVALCARRAE